MRYGPGVGQPLVGRAQLARAAPGRSRRARCRAPRGSHRRRRPPSGRPGTPRPAAPTLRRRTPDRHRHRRSVARHRLDQSRVERRRLAAPPRRHHRPAAGCVGVLLAGIPAHERIGVVRGQEPQPLGRHARQFHRRGEAAQQRRHRRARRHHRTRSVCSALGQQHASAAAPRLAVEPVASSWPLPSSRPMATGITSGCLSGWPGVGGVRCVERQRVALASRHRSCRRHVISGVPA